MCCCCCCCGLLLLLLLPQLLAVSQGAEHQLNALGEPRKAEIYHFERHGRALASPSIYDAIIFGERLITSMESLILQPDEPRHRVIAFATT